VRAPVLVTISLHTGFEILSNLAHSKDMIWRL